MLQTFVSSHLLWLPPELGGRKQPPPGPVYTPTARFAEDGLDKMFSVVLRLSPTKNGNTDLAQEAELGILFPEMLANVSPKMQPGCQLLIHEGKRVVAICTVARRHEPEENCR